MGIEVGARIRIGTDVNVNVRWGKVG